MPTLKQALAKNLERILREKNLSQTEFAKKIGTTFKTVNTYVNAKAGISTEMIAKIADALEIEETELVAGPKLAPQDYKAFYDLSIAVENLRKENEYYKASVKKTEPIAASQLNNPETQELISLFSSLNEMERRGVLVNIRSVARTVASGSSIKDKIKKTS